MFGTGLPNYSTRGRVGRGKGWWWGRGGVLWDFGQHVDQVNGDDNKR